MKCFETSSCPPFFFLQYKGHKIIADDDIMMEDKREVL
jgi:hypothetical protein